MPIAVAPVAQDRIVNLSPVPVLPGAGAGMTTMVGSESVFDSLRWQEIWAKYRTPIVIGGLAAGAVVYKLATKKKKKGRRR